MPAIIGTMNLMIYSYPSKHVSSDNTCLLYCFKMMFIVSFHSF